MADETVELGVAAAASGLHHLTFAKLKEAVQHALGKTTLDSTTDLGEIVNDGIALFTTLHPWHWREKSFTVETVVDQNYVALPDDFGELHTRPHVSDSAQLSDIGPASSLDQIQMLRATTLSGTAAVLRYCVSYKPGGDSESLPTPVLELWPTPTDEYDITGTYRRVIRKLVDDADVPDIPVQFHQLLKRVIRAHALEEDDQVDAAERAWAKVNDLLQTAINADGRMDDTLGRMQGAVGRNRINASYSPTIELEP